MKLLRTIRFDSSDERVFELAAAAGEWAISGAFDFADLSPEDIKGKIRQAFANGFLGVASFGRSTFATVADADPAVADEIAFRLARRLVEAHGAPDTGAAWHAAKDEADFITALCRDLPVNTVLTVRRTFAPDGQIKEEFRTIKPPSGEPMHARIWTVEPD
ncbi:MAG: hypothetical protein KJZ80_03220 [Hyphomicrobiaceae bacterium]|nr:hypothetical protein [Hyphomicrobiaceae bacterium]